MFADDVVDLIVGQLKLTDLALVALRLSHTFNRAARRRLSETQPILQAICDPFSALQLKDLLGAKRLNLTCKGKGGGCIQTLCAALSIGALPLLTELWLGDNQIGDDGATVLGTALANHTLPALKIISLHNNQIGDAGGIALASAVGNGAMPHLTHLYLTGNQIGDEGLAALATAMGNGDMPSSECLHLGSTLVGDAGVAALAVAMRALVQLSDLRKGASCCTDAQGYHYLSGGDCVAASAGSAVPVPIRLYLDQTQAHSAQSSHLLFRRSLSA